MTTFESYSNFANTITMLLSYLNLLLNYLFLFILILFIAFIIIEALSKTSSSSSPLKFSYISIFIIACSTHALVFIITKISESFIISTSNSQENSISQINIIAKWYHSFNTGFANSMLTLNQITAMLFTVKYHTIWKSYVTIFVIFLTLIYPILINLPTINHSSSCFLNSLSSTSTTTNCKISSYSISSQLTASLHTCINAIFSLLLLIATVYIVRKRNYQNSTKIECTILFQSFYGSIMLVIYSLITIIAINRIYIKDFIGYNSLNALADMFHTFYYIVMLLILFVTNPTMRNNFADFYHFHVFSDVYKGFFKPNNDFKPIDGGGCNV